MQAAQEERGLGIAGRICGAVFVACFLGDIFILPGEPDPGSSTAAMAHYFDVHSGAVQTVSLLHTLGGAAFLVFLAGLVGTSSWRRAPGLRRLALLAALAAGGLGLMSYVAGGTGAYLATRSGDHLLTGVAAQLEYVASSYADLPLALFLFACAAVWHGWRRALAAVAGVLLVLGVVVTYQPSSILGLAGFAGSVLFAVCILVVSIAPPAEEEETESPRIEASTPVLG